MNLKNLIAQKIEKRQQISQEQTPAKNINNKLGLFIISPSYLQNNIINQEKTSKIKNQPPQAPSFDINLIQSKIVKKDVIANQEQRTVNEIFQKNVLYLINDATYDPGENLKMQQVEKEIPTKSPIKQSTPGKKFMSFNAMIIKKVNWKVGFLDLVQKCFNFLKKLFTRQKNKNEFSQIRKREIAQIKKENNKRDRFIMSSECNVRIGWDLICMFIILYELIMIPFRLSFEDDSDDLSSLEKMDLPFNCIFLFDIFLNFNTSIFEKGIQIYDRKIITVTYLKVWFWLDLASSFPYSDAIELIQMNSYGGDSGSSDQIQQSAMILRLVKFFRFFKVLRLLRIAKLKTIFTKIVEYLNFSQVMLGLLGLFKLSIIVIVLAHWLACLWNLVGKVDPENNWLLIYGIAHDPWDIKYMSSIYWSITTMITVGYGDIYPINKDEKLFGIFSMLLACGIFAYTMNTMGSVISSLEQYTPDFKSQMSKVNRYLKNKQIKVDKQINIKKYLEYIYEKQEQTEQQTLMLKQLNSSLKNDLLYEVNCKVLQCCSLLMNTFQKKFLYNLTLVLQETIAVPEEVIINEDLPELDDHSIYFIQKGEMEVFFFRSNTVITEIYSGSYFGEISFFSGQQRTSSVRSTDFSNLFHVKRQLFLDLIVKYPQDYEKFCQIKDNINHNQDYQLLNIKCFSCKQPDHVAKNCPNIQFFIQRDKFIQELQNPMPIFPERMNKKYHALMDRPHIINQFDEFQMMAGFEDMIREYQNLHDIKGEPLEEYNIQNSMIFEQATPNYIGHSRTYLSKDENSQSDSDEDINFIPIQQRIVGKRQGLTQLSVESNMIIFQSRFDFDFYNELKQYQKFDKVKNFKEYFVKNNISSQFPLPPGVDGGSVVEQ